MNAPATLPGGPRPSPASWWTDAEPLECVASLPEAPDVVTFSFQSPSGALFHFLPGQFLTLELPVPGGPLLRTFTISSSPSRPTSLTITVKAQDGSIGARWMIDNLVKGMTLKAHGPAGNFTCAGRPSRKLLFISAGSGITPMNSMMTWLYDSGREMDIVAVNCARRPSEIIFRQRMETMASRMEGIDLKWVVSGPDPYKPWTGYQGRFNQLMLGLMAPDYLERDVYCCGPDAFMQAVREALTGLGFDMERYFQESFHPPAPEEPAPAEDVVPDEESRAEVVFASSGLSARCNETDTLLNVARAAGAPIPSGCTFGVCGACKTKKVEGQVHMVHNGGITEDDIEAGYVLACCSHPIGKVVLEA
ncbi:2Fe-2S iron-sulfur cluster-binding protein [Rhodovulum sp. DZ06]|uniref:2Fe-2S iron-sulfur cluster-binding protein n=1 Tax=Rhodovulum sp. DZ06 TaxID=3425126 RepID=UPI003D330522